MKLSRAIHRVNVIYRPEIDGGQAEEIAMSFSTEFGARDFVTRQLKLPQVLSARYIGTKG